jgi:hypothetical protein
MNTSPNSSAPTLHHNLTAVITSLKRTAVLGGRILAPAPAMGEVLLVGGAIAFGLSLGLATSRVHAAEPATARDAGTLLLHSHAFVADAASFEMEQTKVEKMTPFVAGQAIAPSRERTESLVMRVVNGSPMITEVVTTDPSGLPLRAIRRGEGIVMKLGDQPWQVPSGQYAQFKEQLATPYACPLPGRGPDSPQWKFVGTTQEQGAACDIIETVGDSAVGYVTGVMNKSMAAADPANRPAVKVESYVSRQWIAQADAQRLRTEQTGRIQLTMHPSPGRTVDVHLETTGTTVYRRYGKVTIEIPAEAERLLAASAVRPSA